MNRPSATVVIATKDRRGELREAIASVLRQTCPAEVLVMDDGSSDGTHEMVMREFPQVRLERSEQPEGPIAQRNRGTELARAPIIVSLDDDARFESPRTLEQTLRDFDHPRVGAVTIPFVDVLHGPEVRLAAPQREGIWVSYSFVAAAAAYRRDVFLTIGGYRTSLIRNYWEEPDLCLRMLDAGYVTRAGRAEPALHEESPERPPRARAELSQRNDILVACMTTPARRLPRHLLALTANRRPVPFVSHTLKGYRAAIAHRHERRPVAPQVFAARQRLWKRGPLPLGDVERSLAAPAALNRA
jgi:glycosyltransferase involved in cell wall biosynthesis